MNLKFWQKKETSIDPVLQQNKPRPVATYAGDAYVFSFDGEKNLGEIGPVVHYVMDFARLRARSWQSYIESDLIKTIINRYNDWIIGPGLRLDASPAVDILAANGIDLNAEQFNKVVESRFKVWAQSKQSTWAGLQSFNALSYEIYKHAQLGGDVLVVLRVKNGMMKVEMIDGAHLTTPYGSLGSRDRVCDGIKLDKNGGHVEYYVRGKDGKTVTIPAISKSSGLTMAFLVYGTKYRNDNQRGIPAAATSLQSVKQIDRYRDAAVGSAEERQKIAYTINHNQFSDGENPFAQQLAQASGFGSSVNDGLPEDNAGEQLADQVAATTERMAFNMPIGAEMKMLESKNELFFKEFYETNAHVICASVGIPPNVAFMLYNDSFSASRAATKDWEHTMKTARQRLYDQLFSRVYTFWLYVEALNNRVDAPGLIGSSNASDPLLAEAYTFARFTGPMFPHIDPLKEVNAERAKLGPKFAAAPLTTLEQATEALASGEAETNLEQAAEELQKAKDLEIITDPVEQPTED